MVIAYERKKVVGGLVTFSLVLIALSILANILTYVFGHGFLYGLIPEFNLDKENNIPTIFISLLLAGAAFLFWIVGKDAQNRLEPYHRRYGVITGVLVFMALDEMSSLHELLINPLQATGLFSGAFHFSWVVVYIPLLLLFGLWMLRFYLSLSRDMKLGLFLAAVVYVGGALGIEMVGGMIASSRGEANLLYGLTTTLEESFELFGLLLLWNTLLKRIAGSEAATFTVSLRD